ncbi:DHS-like NAD/FAD-binding domain-containing protein, partial [Clavulina sp. PMI_390]
IYAGAGISVASGIPDFRSADGLFRTLKDENPKELLSSGKDLFDSSVPERTALFYKMIAQLATLSTNAAPSPFHHFLRKLDQRGQLLRLYTQNIDSLEEKAGLSSGVPLWPLSSKAVAAATSPRCIPLHGTLKTLICQRCTHAIPLLSQLETLAQGHSVPCPQCTEAGSARVMEGKRHRGIGKMRPSVVLYGEEHLAGEGVGEWSQRPSASAQPDLLIVAGSSLKVPGTKRIVREFAKAAEPPRTIYLNLDFPVPTRDWKGVFDVWVQGDVQALVELLE